MSRFIPHGTMCTGFPCCVQGKSLLARCVLTTQPLCLVAAGLTRNAHPCARSQLLKFHVYNLTEYAAVGFTDGDVAIVNPEEFVKLLRCASDHKTLYAPGKIGSPINYGMFVTMPSQAAFDAAVWFAREATYTRHGIREHRGGWNFVAAWPTNEGVPFAGYGCDQGMAWVFFCGSGLALASDTYKACFL